MSAEVKVLLIEDNLDLQEIVHQFLAAYGFHVIAARDGQEGLDAYERDRPDIVLCDVLLPRVNGFQICERIKKGANPTPVVLMSALYKTYNLQKEAKSKYGADEYLIKPLNLVAVAKLLCDLLGIERPTRDAAPPPSASAAELQPAPATSKPGEGGPRTPSRAETFDIAPEKVDAPPPGPEPENPPAPPLPASGRIADAPVEQTLAQVYLQGATGKLTITAPPITRQIYIKGGMPLYVQSNSPAETFTQLLVVDDKINAEQLGRAERMARERKTTVGKFLVENGMIDAADLAAYLLREVDSRLIAAIAQAEGEYTFAADASWTEKIKRPEMELFDLTYKALLRKDNAAALLRRYLPAQKKAVVKNEERLPLVGRIQWCDEHLEAFMLIDGERTVRQVTEESGQTPLIVHQMLYTLELFDMIRFR